MARVDEGRWGAALMTLMVARPRWPALAREHPPPLPVTTFSSPQKNWSMGNHAHPIRHLIDTSTLNREGHS